MKQLMVLRVCLSGKRCFQTYEHAEGGVHRTEVRNPSVKKKFRIYECPDCKQYHITSMSLKAYKAGGRVK